MTYRGIDVHLYENFYTKWGVQICTTTAFTSLASMWQELTRKNYPKRICKQTVKNLLETRKWDLNDLLNFAKQNNENRTLRTEICTLWNVPYFLNNGRPLIKRLPQIIAPFDRNILNNHLPWIITPHPSPFSFSVMPSLSS